MRLALFLLPCLVFLLPRDDLRSDLAALPTEGTSEAAFVANEAPLRWYKGNTHTHTFWSDGNDFPEMVAEWYRKNDYQFLVLSDHNVLHVGKKWLPLASIEKRGGKAAVEKYEKRFGKKWIKTREKKGKTELRLRTLEEYRGFFEKKDEFLFVPGEEVTDRYMASPVHINAINLQKLIKPRHGKSLREVMRKTLQAIHEQSKSTGVPIISHLNHPNFHYGVTAEDIAHVVEEEFFEVYNGHPSVKHQGDATHASVERMWDIANTLRLGELKTRPVFGIGTDDSHHYHGKGKCTTGKGWIMVRSRRLHATDLLEALRAGEFYASSGVTLDALDFDPKRAELSLTIRPQQGAKYVTRFIGTRKDYVRKSEPVLNKNGAKLRVTRRYDASVGAVLAEVPGLKASYRLKGDELYVRAVVISDQAPVNPSFKKQKQKAWTQPVGWKKHVR